MKAWENFNKLAETVTNEIIEGNPMKISLGNKFGIQKTHTKN